MVVRGCRADAVGGTWMKAAQRHGPASLIARQAGIDTYQAPVVYMRADCDICRSEGFEAQARVVVGYNGRSVIATVHHFMAEWLPHGEVGLSEAAWRVLALVLIDVPVGPTARVRSAEAAAELGKLFSLVGDAIGLELRVVVTDGIQPIERGIGPALEARGCGLGTPRRSGRLCRPAEARPPAGRPSARTRRQSGRRPRQHARQSSAGVRPRLDTIQSHLQGTRRHARAADSCRQRCERARNRPLGRGKRGATADHRARLGKRAVGGGCRVAHRLSIFCACEKPARRPQRRDQHPSNVIDTMAEAALAIRARVSRGLRRD